MLVALNGTGSEEVAFLGEKERMSRYKNTHVDWSSSLSSQNCLVIQPAFNRGVMLGHSHYSGHMKGWS